MTDQPGRALVPLVAALSLWVALRAAEPSPPEDGVGEASHEAGTQQLSLEDPGPGGG
jgi:hypothetical protein